MPIIPMLAPVQGRLDPAAPSTRAAMAPGLAVAGIGQAITDLAAPFAAKAEQIRKLEDAGDEFKIRAGWEQAAAKTEADLETNPDPMARIKATESLIADQRTKLAGAQGSERTRERAGLQFQEWEHSTRMRAANKAAKLTQQRTGEAFNLEWAAANKSGDRSQALRAIETRKANDLVTPEAEQAMLEDFDRNASTERFMKELDVEPITAISHLESEEFATENPALGPDDIRRLRRHAEPIANRSKADLWDKVLNQSLDGNLVSQESIKEMAESGMISPEQRAGYLATYWGPKAPTFDPTLYEDAFSVISGYNPAKDETGATLAQLRAQLGTLPLPKESLQELSSRLTTRANPAEPKAKKRHRLQADFQQRTDQHFDEGKFGKWFAWDLPRDADGKAIPGKEQTKIITSADWSKALTTKRRFLDQWDAFIQNSPEGIDPAEAEKVYSSIFEKVVLDADDSLPTGGGLPPAPAAVEFDDIDGLLGDPPASSKLPAQSSTFGGVPILPPGRFYQNATPTVFGGTSDPDDNGLSAFGGTTGEGGREGVAIPHDILKATFPGKDKAWFEKNVRVAVRTEDGRRAVFPVADLGTAERIWKRNGKPTLDLTPGAVAQLGGAVIREGGKMTGLRGIGNLSFALTTASAGPEADLSALSWEDASAAWFRDKKPTAPEQIASGLAALRTAWNSAQLREEPEGDAIIASNLKTAASAQ